MPRDGAAGGASPVRRDRDGRHDAEEAGEGIKAAEQAGAQPDLLAGGIPQIAEAEGEAPARVYIALCRAERGMSRGEPEALIRRSVPGVRKADEALKALIRAAVALNVSSRLAASPVRAQKPPKRA